MPDPVPTQQSATEKAGARAEAFGEFLREEETGGKLLLAAAALALLWANVAGDSYRSLWALETAIPPAWLHLDLTLGDWAADGLLAIFFFIAGMELKRELVVGELSDRRAATLPVFAAVGGMIAPALITLAVSGGAAGGGAWAIPVATDIAFALGVLALAAAALPPGVRVLLLSVAVVDDLLAITLIAVLFTADLSIAWLAAGVAVVGLYWLAFRHRVDRTWLLWALAVLAWVCVHASGVHATVTGILLALLTPVKPRPGEEHSVSDRFEHRLHPISAGVAVPIFAPCRHRHTAGRGRRRRYRQDRHRRLLRADGWQGHRHLRRRPPRRLPRRRGAARSRHLVRCPPSRGARSHRVHRQPADRPTRVDDTAAQERSAAAILAASVLASALAVVLLRRRSRA